MTRAKLSRRSLLGLGALSLGAVGLGAWLRRGIPLGEDISDRIDVAAIASQPGFPSEGPAKAAITMLVFSDYACGVCRQVEPWWREAVRAAGDVRVVHRDWPILGRQSVRAARLALAADRQERYIQVHNALMRSSGLDDGALRTAVVEAGGDWVRIESDLSSHLSSIDRLLVRTGQDAFRIGLSGTPSFLIGPIRIVGWPGDQQFADAIERARAALDIGRPG